ncbi:MAG: hypothetical protein AB7Q29_16100 [Vicinamibacterales bacterium]
MITVGGLLAEVVRDGLRAPPVRDRCHDRLIFVFDGPRGRIQAQLEQNTLRDVGSVSDALDALFERTYDRLEADLLDVSGWRAAVPLLVG